MTEKEYNEIMAARKEYQKKYHREWAARNKDKIQAINARFYAKKAAEKRQAAEEEQKGDNKK